MDHRHIVLLLLLGCSKPERFSFEPLDPVKHCIKHIDCYTEQYGQFSVPELKLCISGMKEQYEKTSTLPRVRALVDAFYDDCKEIDSCGYVFCFDAHVNARPAGRVLTNRVGKDDAGVGDGGVPSDGGN